MQPRECKAFIFKRFDVKGPPAIFITAFAELSEGFVDLRSTSSV
jgi:hypothetical protein